MRGLHIALGGIVTLFLLSPGPLAAGGSQVDRSASPGVMTLMLPLAHAGMDHDASGEDGNHHQTGWQHFVSWIGHFHPAMTVFPIAMILSAALAELLRITTRAPWLDGASRWCMIVGGIGAAITAPLGWAFAAGHGGSKLLEIHRWLGTAAGVGAVVLLILSELARRRGGGSLTLFRTVLFLTVPLVGATGFFGGAMVYGIHEYDWNRPSDEDSQSNSQADHSQQSTSAPSSVTVITMTDKDTFSPDKVTIRAGTTVRWKNASTDTHTVTDDRKAASDAKDVALPSGAKPFDSGEIKPGGTYEQTFTVPGTYHYVCKPHEEMDMKGQVIVTGAGGSSPSPTPEH